MGLDANFPNPNDKIIKKLVLDFARNSAKKSEESETSRNSAQSENATDDSLTVVRETDDGYVVRITKTDEKTGAQNVRTEFVSREAFEAGVRAGYLKKITNDGEHK